MLDDIKKTLWVTANKFRANMDAAKYKHGRRTRSRAPNSTYRGSASARRHAPSDDLREGLAAFAARREPRFSGR